MLVAYYYPYVTLVRLSIIINETTQYLELRQGKSLIKETFTKSNGTNSLN